MTNLYQALLPLEGVDNVTPPLPDEVEQELVQCLAILLLQVRGVETGKEDSHES